MLALFDPRTAHHPVKDSVNTHDRDLLVTDHLPLVGYIVSDLCAKATNLDRSELASAGQFALVKASRSYDPDRGVPFDAYARIRINGALADELRSKDWASRGNRKKLTELGVVTEQLTSTLGRTPTNDELGNILGVGADTIRDIKGSNVGAPVPLSEDFGLVSQVISPEESAENQERDRFLRAAVENLPDRLRFIVTRLFFEDKRVQDVADELGITHVSVSQARNEAVRFLRDGWSMHFDGVPGHDVAPVKEKTKRGQYLRQLGEYSAGNSVTA
ncbi:sigma-70 family RNA polymerase sigma factor [Curtobacterium sp. MCBD17_040]|uniref:sigma-70 family RNA polymerase sigma factor n=1 Tax=Curtobacterium sp. MCBD17_040 TaxID=2175674 RepID=UPI000DA8EC57|nr:sigma-70 family RNA polymerase sigma factor [Curtobacterium sp. MCBD17_040]WIB65566.1 sigma-70 family RNA polymerase sigma factor [Curtobacterium sp. MCBD17_040]